MYGKITVYQGRVGIRFLEYFDQSQKQDEFPAGSTIFVLIPVRSAGRRPFSSQSRLVPFDLYI